MTWSAGGQTIALAAAKGWGEWRGGAPRGDGRRAGDAAGARRRCGAPVTIRVPLDAATAPGTHLVDLLDRNMLIAYAGLPVYMRGVDYAVHGHVTDVGLSISASATTPPSSPRPASQRSSLTSATARPHPATICTADRELLDPPGTT
jgi:hypothetical protein